MDKDTPSSDISSIDISIAETTPKCTATNCFDPDNKDTLKCSVSKCGRLVHYKCSMLPPYQVQIHLNNQNKRNKATFICFNCVEVSKDIVSLCGEENHEKMKLKKIINERDRQIEDIKAAKKELNNKFQSHKIKYNNIREKIVEAQVLEELNQKIKEQINELGESIKSSVLKEIQSTLNNVETKVTEAQKSYADATKAASTPVSTSGLKSIVKEARYEEIKERRDHDQRQSNVIIHGVAECSEKKEDGDNEFVETLVKTIKISTPTIKSISRIGAEAVDKKRSIKVVLGSEKEKMTFLRNLSPLKGNKRYEGVSVTEDLTPTERSVLKEWTDKAKDLNLDYTDWVYRVRGDSKNGYYLKKFPRIQSK